MNKFDVFLLHQVGALIYLVTYKLLGTIKVSWIIALSPLFVIMSLLFLFFILGVCVEIRDRLEK